MMWMTGEISKVSHLTTKTGGQSSRIVNIYMYH